MSRLAPGYMVITPVPPTTDRPCDVPSAYPLEGCGGKAKATVQVVYHIPGGEPTTYYCCPADAGAWATNAADPVSDEWLGYVD